MLFLSDTAGRVKLFRPLDADFPGALYVPGTSGAWESAISSAFERPEVLAAALPQRRPRL